MGQLEGEWEAEVCGSLATLWRPDGQVSREREGESLGGLEGGGSIV